MTNGEMGRRVDGGMDQASKQWGTGWMMVKATNSLNHDMVLFYRTIVVFHFVLFWGEGGRWGRPLSTLPSGTYARYDICVGYTTPETVKVLSRY